MPHTWYEAEALHCNCSWLTAAYMACLELRHAGRRRAAGWRIIKYVKGLLGSTMAKNMLWASSRIFAQISSSSSSTKFVGKLAKTLWIWRRKKTLNSTQIKLEEGGGSRGGAVWRGKYIRMYTSRRNLECEPIFTFLSSGRGALLTSFSTCRCFHSSLVVSLATISWLFAHIIDDIWLGDCHLFFSLPSFSVNAKTMLLTDCWTCWW